MLRYFQQQFSTALCTLIVIGAVLLFLIAAKAAFPILARFNQNPFLWLILVLSILGLLGTSNYATNYWDLIAEKDVNLTTLKFISSSGLVDPANVILDRNEKIFLEPDAFELNTILAEAALFTRAFPRKYSKEKEDWVDDERYEILLYKLNLKPQYISNFFLSQKILSEISIVLLREIKNKKTIAFKSFLDSRDETNISFSTAHISPEKWQDYDTVIAISVPSTRDDLFAPGGNQLFFAINDYKSICDLLLSDTWLKDLEKEFSSDGRYVTRGVDVEKLTATAVFWGLEDDYFPSGPTFNAQLIVRESKLRLKKAVLPSGKTYSEEYPRTQ